MPTRLTAPQRRRELLRAATAVFARTNYRAARVGDIAAEAGVSEPMLYRHFPSKKALFCELLDRIGRRILEIWAEAVVDAPDALEALRRAGQVYVTNLAEHPAEARLQFQALAESADPEIAEVLRANHERYVAFFEALLDRGRAEGVVRADVDRRTTAWILDGMGVAFTVRDLLFPEEVTAGGRAGNAATIESMIDWLAAASDPNDRSPRPPAPAKEPMP
jgi:AcrR family transcriptional regulator